MKKNLKMAAVFHNQDFYWFITQVIGMIAVTDPQTPPQYLTPDTEAAQLGETLRRCLNSSHHLEMNEFQKLWQAGVFHDLDNKNEVEAANKYGYKNRQHMYRQMNRCSVEQVDGKIKIQPMHHKSLGCYSATTHGPQALVVDASISDRELGFALAEAFKHCT